MKKYTQRKDGRYQAKVHIGKGQYTYLYDTSVKKLDKKVAELKIKLGKGVDVHAERDSLKEWIDRWLQHKKYEVSESRMTAYKCSVKRLEPLYNVPIGKIRAADLQDIAFDMFEQGLAAKTIKDFKNATNQVFKMAIDNRVLDFNPAANIKVYSNAPQKTRRTLTKEEQEKISGLFTIFSDVMLLCRSISAAKDTGYILIRHITVFSIWESLIKTMHLSTLWKKRLISSCLQMMNRKIL